MEERTVPVDLVLQLCTIHNAYHRAADKDQHGNVIVFGTMLLSLMERTGVFPILPAGVRATVEAHRAIRDLERAAAIKRRLPLEVFTDAEEFEARARGQ